MTKPDLSGDRALGHLLSSLVGCSCGGLSHIQMQRLAQGPPGYTVEGVGFGDSPAGESVTA